MSLKSIRPAAHFPRCTPDTDNDVATRGALEEFPTGISIGVAGTLVVHDLDGNTQTFSATELAVGIIHPIRVRRVLATSTADEIRLYYDV